jgi:Family of unknown function (DUF6228)
MRAILWSAPSAAHTGRIEFANARHRRGYTVVTGIVEMDGDEYAVEIESIDPYLRDMLGFVTDMAANAHGWVGLMSWEAEDAVMRLDARNRGTGEVDVDILIRWPPKLEEEWTGTLQIRADSLPNAATAMRTMSGLERGQRFSFPGHPPTWQPLPRDPGLGN